MNPPPPKLLTPIYPKLTPDMPWPEHEKMFYVLASNGLYRCRNTPFYRSSVLTTDFPSELAAHDQSLKLSYPKIPRRDFEKIIGYFARIGLRHCAEAAVLLAWNQPAQRLEIVVPEQLSLVSNSWHGKAYPIEVHYEIPKLPAGWLLLGDIHSHVDGPAYASYQDKDDELHRPGLHIVVGRIHEEPPEFHIEVSVDGARFRVKNIETVVEGYHHRRTGEVPQAWLDKVTVKSWSSYKNSDSYQGTLPTPYNSATSDNGSSYYNSPHVHEATEDEDETRDRDSLAGPIPLPGGSHTPTGETP